MQKRLTRYEMLFTLGFLFMLVCVVAAFFFGVQVGTAKVENRAEMNPLGAASPAKPFAYQQQDLVSFYHTVYLPFREFQSVWIDSLDKLESGQLASSSSVLKELGQLARRKGLETEAAQVSAASPLLVQARSEYSRSLSLIAEAADNLRKSAGQSSLLKSIEADSDVAEAKRLALLAQRDFYAAMEKWGSSVDPKIPGDYKQPAVLELSKWKSLPLTVKNKLIAELLLNRGKWTTYMPHDLTSRIDQLVRSGEAGKLKMQSMNAAASLLIGTDAVRSGDFLAGKAKLYANETLPQLPFFIPVVN
ncbi:hypothetical protein [Paenibacillus beijingensis]|uniref:Uncharacterized protein n=1 Tax=Paenibacillus beijingensis TaxID=1126833 RepID=A0A0D5NPM1_9BACL|nr:hypothetical protein [Paenibacillus beijingensis]AJY77201.1 hypothetical protein VN24_24915 [Paenibacillus beijingensis]